MLVDLVRGERYVKNIEVADIDIIDISLYLIYQYIKCMEV